MSQLQVTTLESNTVSANVITAGQTTVNSSGLYLNSTSGVINTSAIVVSNSSGNVILQGTMNLASITIGGTAYTSLIAEAVNTQIFTANGTWTKPGWATTGNELVVVHAWGGGGGGYVDAEVGGGGGAFVFGYFKSSQCNSTCNVVVGRAGLNQPFNTATAGGNTIFYANSTNSLVAYGGGPGRSDLSTQAYGGGGGGWLSDGTGNTTGTFPGGPLTRSANSTTEAIDSTFGGGGGAWGNTTTGRPPKASIYGGGGGTGSDSTGVLFSSIFGGAGGRSTGPVLTSVYGGSGGNNTVAATAPGGGGGRATAAARGEVRVYTYRILA